jgi:hypothetical protein
VWRAFTLIPGLCLVTSAKRIGSKRVGDITIESVLVHISVARVTPLSRPGKNRRCLQWKFKSMKNLAFLLVKKSSV